MPQATTTAGDQPNDLVSSLPAPVLRLLVLFARPIAFLKRALEVLCWKAGRRVESWIVVGSWWALCFGSSYAFKFLFPAVLFLPLLPLSKLRIGPQAASPVASIEEPTTSDTLLSTLSDLHAIHALLPPSPIPTVSSLYARFAQLGPRRLTRGLVVLWMTWFILGRLIGYRPLLALLGSVILLLPSPTLAHIVNLLSKSLAIRRSIGLVFLFTFGSPPDRSYPISINFSPMTWLQDKWAVSRRPSLAFAFHPLKKDSTVLQGSAIAEDELSPEEQPGEPIYFRFEVHENQRWWMGLDWTGALLPQERPSWCDSHLLPASPPATFPLPSAASILLPAPTKSDLQSRVKRVATWRWLDDDWSVVRSGMASGIPTTNQAPQAPPSPPEPENQGQVPNPSQPRSISGSLGTSPQNQVSSALDEAMSAKARAHSLAEQAFTKGLERLKARTGSPAGTGGLLGSVGVGAGSPVKSTTEAKRGRTGSQASEDLKDLVDIGHAGPSAAPGETIPNKDDATDQDGWVYGDNKWENTGARGGLGKFTRRRRWHRRAVLSETVIRIPSEEKDEPVKTPNTPLKAPPTSVVTTKPTPILELDEADEARERIRHGLLIPPASPTMSKDDVLRQRLKRAMGNVGG